MPDSYANYAFISYSHKDEKWAAWIQQKLEAYRLPSVIRKEAGSTIPERIRPVFRDATDLGAGRLRNNLQEELEASRFLIVVCSPNSAKPNEEGMHWVNDEVTHFASLGRADRIIPVIVDGDEKTAFCPKLTELGILAVDATKKSRDRTLNDIVAALLDLRPDELWQREERIRRRKRVWRLAACTAALLLAAIGAWRWWDLAGTHVEYYSDWVDEWGIPTGIPSQRLTKDQVRNRLFSYRFEYCGRKKKSGFFSPRILRRVVMQDADGRVLDDNSLLLLEDAYYMARPRIQILRYREDGDLESIDDQDKNGIQIVRHRFYGKNKTDVEHVRSIGGDEIDIAIASETSDSGMFGAGEDSSRTEIKRFSHVRDAKGRIKKTLFKKDRSAKARNADGAYGIEYRLDELGRPEREIFLGYRDEPHATRSGVSGRIRQFSESGQLINTTTINEFDRPIRNLNEGGYAQIHYERDEHGNWGLTTYRDENGKITTDNMGTTGFKADVSEGQLLKLTVLGESGIPILCQLGFTSFSVERSWNNSVITVRFLDENNEPCMTSLGCAAIRRKYQNGDCISTEGLDVDGELITYDDGTAGYNSEWEDHRETKRQYFDIDGNPTPISDGTFGWEAEYDADGLQTKFSLLGGDGLPMPGPDGWASRTREYNDGYPKRVAFYDEEGRRTLTKDGFAGWKSRFEGGNEVEREYFGEDGRPTLSADGIAGYESVFENGRLVERRYFGIGHKPIIHKDGNASIRLTYDDAGHVIRYDWFGLDGEPIIDKKDGTASYKSSFDDSGNEIERWWLGTDGKPCYNTEYGVAGWMAKYDEKGNMVEQIARNPDGTPAVIPEDGACGYQFEYDMFGKMTGQIFLGSDKKPVQGINGYVMIRANYDGFGNKLSETYHDSDGNLVPFSGWLGVAGVTNEFNRLGNKTKVTYIGTDGKPLCTKLGYATEETLFDSIGRQSGTRYYDAKGNLIALPELLVAGWDVEFDKRGNEIRKTWIGTDGKPCRHADGNAGWRAEYDRWGHQTKRVFVDATGQPIALDSNGIAGECAEFDAFGNEIRHVNLGVDERPCKNSEGWAEWKKEFDAFGRVTEQTLFDENGSPCPIPNEGWAAWRKEFKGNSETTVYLDSKGKPTRCKEGWAIERVETDDWGNQLVKSFFAPDDTPMPDNDGCFVIHNSYDGKGRRAATRYFDNDGKYVPAPPNFIYGFLEEYDERGNLAKQSNLGPNGEVCACKDGVASIVSIWNENNKLARRVNLDAKGIPVVPVANGYAVMLRQYDEDENEFTFYCDAESKPMLTADGFSSEESFYDGLQREVQHRFFGLDGKPCNSFSSGTAGWESVWNDRGKEVKRTWLGKDGKPAPHRDGYVSWIAEYDERGRMTRQWFLDAEGKIASVVDGVVGYAWEYDNAGNTTKTIHLDANGNPAISSYGYAVEETDYDIFGRETESRWLDAEGNPALESDSGCAGWRCIRDIYGNITNRVWFGLDGKPCRHKEGYAGYSQTFERSLCTSVRYFDTNEAPVAVHAGYAGTETRFDEFGRMIEQWYLDVDGKPCTDTNGCVRMRWSYDERGLCTEFAELDLDGNLFSNAVHAAVKCVFAYDERGHETIRKFIDANGAISDGPNGFAVRTMKCDFAGRPVEQAYQDVDGKPVRSRENGVAIERREWEDRGNLVAVRYFDEKDMPCVCSNGYASIKKVFDIRGFATNVLHRGVDGKLIALPESGCAGWNSEIDRLGNEVRRTWIGTNGKPASDKNGAFGWTSVFARGKETERRWIGEDGSPCRASDGTLGWDKTYDEYGTELTKTDLR